VKLLRVLPLIGLLCACGVEPPAPRSVEEFMADRVILDATLSRCNSTGSENEYEQRECSNAQRAVERLWRQREMELAQEREKQFAAKRESLRLRQEREEALRRAREAEERARAMDVYNGHVFAEPGGRAAASGYEDGIDAAASGSGALGMALAGPATPQPDTGPVADQAGVSADESESTDIEARIRRLEEELRRRRIEANTKEAVTEAVGPGD
jgi:hypothetical protein